MPAAEEYRQAAQDTWSLFNWLHRATCPSDPLRDKLYAALVPLQLQLNRLLQPLGIAATLSRYEGVEALVSETLDGKLVSALCHILTVLTQPAFTATWAATYQQTASWWHLAESVLMLTGNFADYIACMCLKFGAVNYERFGLLGQQLSTAGWVGAAVSVARSCPPTVTAQAITYVAETTRAMVVVSNEPLSHVKLVVDSGLLPLAFHVAYRGSAPKAAGANEGGAAAAAGAPEKGWSDGGGNACDHGDASAADAAWQTEQAGGKQHVEAFPFVINLASTVSGHLRLAIVSGNDSILGHARRCIQALDGCLPTVRSTISVLLEALLRHLRLGRSGAPQPELAPALARRWSMPGASRIDLVSATSLADTLVVTGWLPASGAPRCSMNPRSAVMTGLLLAASHEFAKDLPQARLTIGAAYKWAPRVEDGGASSNMFQRIAEELAWGIVVASGRVQHMVDLVLRTQESIRTGAPLAPPAAPGGQDLAYEGQPLPAVERALKELRAVLGYELMLLSRLLLERPRLVKRAAGDLALCTSQRAQEGREAAAGSRGEPPSVAAAAAKLGEQGQGQGAGEQPSTPDVKDEKVRELKDPEELLAQQQQQQPLKPQQPADKHTSRTQQQQQQQEQHLQLQQPGEQHPGEQQQQQQPEEHPLQKQQQQQPEKHPLQQQQLPTEQPPPSAQPQQPTEDRQAQQQLDQAVALIEQQAGRVQVQAKMFLFLQQQLSDDPNLADFAAEQQAVAARQQDALQQLQRALKAPHEQPEQRRGRAKGLLRAAGPLKEVLQALLVAAARSQALSACERGQEVRAVLEETEEVVGKLRLGLQKLLDLLEALPPTAAAALGAQVGLRSEAPHGAASVAAAVGGGVAAGGQEGKPQAELQGEEDQEHAETVGVDDDDDKEEEGEEEQEQQQQEQEQEQEQKKTEAEVVIAAASAQRPASDEEQQAAGKPCPGVEQLRDGSLTEELDPDEEDEEEGEEEDEETEWKEDKNEEEEEEEEEEEGLEPMDQQLQQPPTQHKGFAAHTQQYLASRLAMVDEYRCPEEDERDELLCERMNNRWRPAARTILTYEGGAVTRILESICRSPSTFGHHSFVAGLEAMVRGWDVCLVPLGGGAAVDRAAMAGAVVSVGKALRSGAIHGLAGAMEASRLLVIAAGYSSVDRREQLAAMLLPPSSPKRQQVQQEVQQKVQQQQVQHQQQQQSLVAVLQWGSDMLLHGVPGEPPAAGGSGLGHVAVVGGEPPGDNPSGQLLKLTESVASSMWRVARTVNSLADRGRRLAERAAGGGAGGAAAGQGGGVGGGGAGGLGAFGGDYDPLHLLETGRWPHHALKPQELLALVMCRIGGGLVHMILIRARAALGAGGPEASVGESEADAPAGVAAPQGEAPCGEGRWRAAECLLPPHNFEIAQGIMMVLDELLTEVSKPGCRAALSNALGPLPPAAEALLRQQPCPQGGTGAAAASAGPGPGGGAQQGGDAGDGALRCLQLLAVLGDVDLHSCQGFEWLPGCHSPGCANVSGLSESKLQVRRCAGCGVARFCSPQCQRDHWKVYGHKQRCSEMAACRKAQQRAAPQPAPDAVAASD